MITSQELVSKFFLSNCIFLSSKKNVCISRKGFGVKSFRSR